MQCVSGWHNISTNISPIEVNKVTFEDLVSIINAIKNKKVVRDLESLQEELFQHILDLNNPHNLTTEQLPAQVIDIFYETWLSEGYYGTKDQFIEMLFRYILHSNDDSVKIEDCIATWKNRIDILEAKDSLTTKEKEELEQYKNIVPTVKDFYDYLTKHDVSIEDVHEPLLDSIFHSKPSDYVAPPMLTYSQVSTLPYTVTKLYNSSTKEYVNIPLSSLSFPHRVTIVLHGKYSSGRWLYLRNNDISTKFFSVDVDTIENTVVFTSAGSGSFPVKLTISTTELLQDIRDNADKVTIIVMLDGTKLTGLVRLHGNYLEIPIASTLKEVEGTIYRYPTEPRHTYNTLMTIPRMNHGDYLEEISIYPYVFDNKDLSFIFNIYD